MAEKPNNDDDNNKNGNGNRHMVETSKAERRVWLMKCPPVIARAMQQPPPQHHHHLNHHPNPNLNPIPINPIPLPITGLPLIPPDAAPPHTVAKVVVTVDPLRPNDDSSSTQFTMELAGGAGSSNVSKRYSMDMSTDFIPMSVFSESSQGKLSVEGKIYHKFDMKPHHENIDDYAILCKERTNKYNTRARQIQIIDDDSGMRMRPILGMADVKSSGTPDKRKVTTKGSETKRTRRDPEEMEKIMFKLFENQPNWTLKQLIQKTDQPEQFLKDMLKLLCVYNNKGANQGSYELKPEYRRSKDKADSQ